MTLPNCKCCKHGGTKRCDYCNSYSEFDYEEGSLSALEALYDAPDREKHDETMRNN